MRLHVARAWLAVLLGGAAVAGCRDTSGATYPPDPLFAGKKPIEARAETAAPVIAPSPAPAIPVMPAMIVAASRLRPPAGPDSLAPTPGASLQSPGPKPILQAAPADELTRSVSSRPDTESR